jgi:hypothetical protein
MVGYSALAQRDNELALELLEEHRRLVREIFPRFQGTEIETIGERFSRQFQSVLDPADLGPLRGEPHVEALTQKVIAHKA